MKIFKVVGTVTLSRAHPDYRGGRLIAAESVGASVIGGPEPDSPDLTIVWDELGAGQGALIAVSDGAEAAQPFRPEQKAVDAYCTAILDKIHIDERAVQTLKLTK